ncbi:uncharacterized protein LOC128216328 [Mya arenaria]|uniref:uncharacterized protein LOC128216328 n=1 Tax=Mya arenaria TaxID=6604 RepID=UPI0022E00CDF|nr:uncharacterized protein LOC128216328 [Mya arenaria]
MDDLELIQQFYDEFFGHDSTISRHSHEIELPRVTSDDENDDNQVPSENVNDHVISEHDDDIPVVESCDTLATGCDCTSMCMDSIDREAAQAHIDNIRQYTKEEKDLYIMGALNRINSDKKRSRYGDRQRTRYDYKFEGNVVCKKTFMCVYDIGPTHLKNLLKHVNENGNVPRCHGNQGRRPIHALTFQEIENVISFLKNVAIDEGLPMPAAPRGRAKDAPVFLHSSTTKMKMHKLYEKSCIEAATKCIKYRTFCRLWHELCPNIKIATPQEDVCVTCEMSRKGVADATTDDEKLAAASALERHTNATRKEHKPCSTDFQHAHYTFDFAQNLCLPHHSRQMGPMYFVTPRKFHLFGFRYDALPIQYNFLIDEAETMMQDGGGIHGADAVISLVDYALTEFGHGERVTSLHADNCGGQNKNRYLLAYFCWRTMIGLNEEIRYLMQVAGHARCIIDAGFGRIKALYRRTDCETLSDLG